ncbi:hypothetical protein P7H62_15535, partial [Vagococcus carniphilus]|nr:hypothetical protein [Vagococcus carniphilus]MDT2832414.1 hypothetical protein [Vagococcus carniphilus]MDT2841107.1 hypothetical protein [Vagococcus carniphilus]MDT2855829.1 hypothetical protein [Vagococcus carniphilus]MDT2866535.1 hypothetical protein [Vagococcus carniphilus]
IGNPSLNHRYRKGFYSLFKTLQQNRLAGKFGLNIIRVNAKDRFLGKLAGVSDPETKRKIIGNEFIYLFDDEAAKLDGIDFLAQGTLYTDVI